MFSVLKGWVIPCIILAIFPTSKMTIKTNVKLRKAEKRQNTAKRETENVYLQHGCWLSLHAFDKNSK